MGSSLYDLSLIKEKVGDGDRLKGLLSWFIDDTCSQIEAADQQFAQGGCEQVVKSCHKIRGSAESIGAAELKQAAEEAEQAGRSGEMDLIKEKMDKVKQLFDQISHQLTQEYSL